jgi:hypothetical protein
MNFIYESKGDGDTTLAANRLTLLMSWPAFFLRASSDDGARIGSKPSCEITILGGGLTPYDDYYDRCMIGMDKGTLNIGLTTVLLNCASGMRQSQAFTSSKRTLDAGRI